MPACDIRRAYHMAAISTDASYSHVTERVRKNVSPHHTADSVGMRRDAEMGTRASWFPIRTPSDTDDTSAWMFYEIQAHPGRERRRPRDIHPSSPVRSPSRRREIKYLMSVVLKLRNCDVKISSDIIHFLRVILIVWRRFLSINSSLIRLASVHENNSGS